MKVRNIILGVLTWSVPLWGVWAFELTGGEFPPGWGLILLSASIAIPPLPPNHHWPLPSILSIFHIPIPDKSFGR